MCGFTDVRVCKTGDWKATYFCTVCGKAMPPSYFVRLDPEHQKSMKKQERNPPSPSGSYYAPRP